MSCQAWEERLALYAGGDLEHEHGLPPMPKVMDVLNPEPGWNAVSITYLKQRRLGLLEHPELTPWPERFRPTGRIGKGILIWHFPDLPPANGPSSP